MTARVSWLSVILGVVAFAVVLNVAYMDYAFITGQLPWIRVAQKTTTPSPTPPSQTTDATMGAACSPGCLSAIQSATDAVKASIPTPKPTTQTSGSTGSQAVFPKDYFIPLGSGYTTNNQWTDVGGTDTTINTADYGKVKAVVFQASMHIPVANGTIYARLYNVTDNHPVWNSDVSTGAGASTMMTSQNIALDSGSKLYRVQISTSLQYPSYLDFARIKITIQ